jgi:hypothetical protein
MKSNMEKTSDSSPMIFERLTSVKTITIDPKTPEMVSSNLKVPKTAVMSIKFGRTGSLSEMESNKDQSSSRGLQLKRPGKFKVPSSAVLSQRVPSKAAYVNEDKNSEFLSNCSQQRVCMETDPNGESLLGSGCSNNRKVLVC